MKEVNRTIEDIILSSDISVHDKWSAISLFKALWYDYYEHDIEPQFATLELRDFWFYLKIILLTQVLSRKNSKAIFKLSKEINVNCKKFENPKYVLGHYRTKEEMYENL